MIKKVITACVLALGLGGFGLVGSASTATADSANVCKIGLDEHGIDQPGKDTNPNHEFKRLHNDSGDAVDVEGWYVHDTYPLTYKLRGSKLPADSPFRVDHDSDAATPDHFVMPNNSYVYVYNGTGTDNNPTNHTAALYANLGFHHNNTGDTLSVRDVSGTLVDWAFYTKYRAKRGC